MNPKVPNVPATSYIPPRSKNRCLAKVHCNIGITSKTSQIGRIKYHQKPAKTTNTVQQTKETSGVSVSESWTCEVAHAKMQTSEFPHLLGHSSGSAVSWDVFRGNGTARRFRGYFYGGVFSLGQGLRVFCWLFFVLLFDFLYLRGRPF